MKIVLQAKAEAVLDVVLTMSNVVRTPATILKPMRLAAPMIVRLLDPSVLSFPLTISRCMPCQFQLRLERHQLLHPGRVPSSCFELPYW